MTLPRSFPIVLLLLLCFLACEPVPGSGTGTTASSSGGSSSPSGSSGRQAIDAQKLCSRLIDECKQPLVMAACVKTFGPLRVTSDCSGQLASATCDQLGVEASPVLTTCFPPCSGTLASCNDDGTITLCTADGKTQVADCQASCVADGFTAWTGVCGTTYQGETGDRAQCWCR